MEKHRIFFFFATQPLPTTSVKMDSNKNNVHWSEECETLTALQKSSQLSTERSPLETPEL